ncbi:competence type IV pilus assembly protein ComGB [Heyndrickxia oleronia]|uniref:competence type IV pilus assembly protein ComGB n=1 Tax=Heyndrickxia oleronia TaxID=38875 RepID=UPI001C0EA9F1|nr:competence type IV pilus assembly protein ComGB [Heyndrickxia oleronia]MBU5214329.1 type II secretion system F family protein [Heyndrickxia oleronia]
MDTFPKANTIVVFLMRKNRIPLKVQGMFLNRIGEMLENGFTLAEAIDFLQHLKSNSKINPNDILVDLQNGIPLYEVLNRKKFDKKVCAQLFFADQHGKLSYALKESGTYLAKKHHDQVTMMKLFQYPLLLIFLLAFVLQLLKNFLLPQFELLYSSMNYQPTFTVSFLISLMKNSQFYLLMILILIICVSFFIYLLFRKKNPIERAEWICHIPFVHFYYKLYISHFLAREWSFLLQGGFSVHEILDMMSTQNFKPLIREIAFTIRKELKFGYSFSNALSRLKFLDQQFITITIHGEKNGRLDDELQFYSRFCVKQLEEKIQKIFRLLQPIMFIFIGILVISVYLSILLPMFEMIDSI